MAEGRTTTVWQKLYKNCHPDSPQRLTLQYRTLGDAKEINEKATPSPYIPKAIASSK